jgi:hypothetical protein
VLPPALWPIIGPELATDGVVQPIARQMGLQTLGTLHQRIGDTLLLADSGGEVLVTKNGLVTLANTGEGTTGRASSERAMPVGRGDYQQRHIYSVADGIDDWASWSKGLLDPSS